MEARLKTQLWVAAALRRADQSGHPGAILRRGDPEAGSVLLVMRGRGGLVVLSQTRAQDRPAWLRATGAAPVDEEAADAYVERARRRDPDLWVVEIETPDFAPPFDDPVV